MGRNLAAGVPVKIHVHLKDVDDKSKLHFIKETLNKYVKLDLYNVKKYDNGYVYSLKPEIFNKEIYNTFKEFSKLTNIKFSSYLIDDYDYDDDFLDHLDSDHYKMELVYNFDKDNEEDGILVNGSFNRLDFGYYTEDWFSFEGYMGDVEIHIHIDYAIIWFDYNKIVVEDETALLWFLNKFKVSYFQDCSDLTKSILFYITG